jgi:hypothetical protein
MNAKERNELIDALIDGDIFEADFLRLEAELTIDPTARKAYFDRIALSQALTTEALNGLPKQSLSTTKPSRWFSWRPLTAAAAGIVFGMLCTSAVFGFVVPGTGKVMTLLQEGFEAGPAPLVIGMPIETDKWSGDYTEVVGEQQGVKPAGGTKMLRLLRADFEGKARVEGNYFADVYRLIDVRPYQREFADGGAVVHLSAAFNAFAFPAEEAFGGSVGIHALNAATAADGSHRSEWTIYSDSLAMARNNPLKLDRDPATWQRLGTELRLPPNTEFLLIRISVNHSTPSQRRVSFDGHYVDDVRLSMARRAPLP